MRDVGARDAITVEFSFPFLAVGGVFTVNDQRVKATSALMMQQSGAAPTGKSQDENEFDAFACRCAPSAGSFVAYVDSLLGPVGGNFKFVYVVR